MYKLVCTKSAWHNAPIVSQLVYQRSDRLTNAMVRAPTILIVDDELPIHQVFEKEISRAIPGAVVQHAMDGNAAIAQVESNPPDLILTDLRMPGMDGYELLKRLQTTHPTIPVVVSTGHGSEADAERVMSDGAASYLMKPVKLPTLMKTLRRLLALRQKTSRSRMVRYLTCFISHSHRDQEFCNHLYGRLRRRTSLWYAPRDVRPGEKIAAQIHKAITEYDRLLIVLSEHSISSSWVATEVRAAKRREDQTGRRVLFPIRLTSFEALKQWSIFDADSGSDIAREIREYYIPDFSSWANDDEFAKEFDKLVASLRLPYTLDELNEDYRESFPL